MIFIHKTNDHTWLQAWAACNHLCSLHGLKSLPSSKYGTHGKVDLPVHCVPEVGQRRGWVVRARRRRLSG